MSESLEQNRLYPPALSELVQQHNSLLKAATSELDAVGARYAREMKPILHQLIDEVIRTTELTLGPIEIDVSELGITKSGLKVVGTTNITKQGIQKDVHLIDDGGMPHTIESETIGVTEFVTRMHRIDSVAAVTDRIFEYLCSIFEKEPESGPYA